MTATFDVAVVVHVEADGESYEEAQKRATAFVYERLAEDDTEQSE